jgi:hypothetical protein
MIHEEREGARRAELKALDRLSGREEAQALNYLKATQLRLALLSNFGSAGRPEWKRLILYMTVRDSADEPDAPARLPRWRVGLRFCRFAHGDLAI